jgi:hypothetical protein
MDEYLAEALAAMRADDTIGELFLVTVTGYSLDKPAMGQTSWVMVGTVPNTVERIRALHGWERFTPTRISLTAPEMIFGPHVINP